MNDTTPATTEQVFRRLEEPLKLFGNTVPPWAWLAILGGVLLIGFFYIGWMYLRDSRTIGPWWASFLGLLRTGVYVLLALVFLMPAKQTWHESRQRSKVLLFIDASLSMGTRDGIPRQGESLKALPTRSELVAKLLQSEQKKV